MDGNVEATLSAMMEAIDWGTAATLTNVVCAAGIALATWGLLRATRRLVHETRRQAVLVEAEAEAKEQPDVRAWLYPRLGGVLPHLELVVANIGPGTAKNVRWWYEDVDREEWKARHIGGINWPHGQRHAAGIDVMRNGDDVRSHLTGGRHLVAPDGVGDYDYAQHSQIKPFSIVIEYESLSGKAHTRRVRLDPRPLYGVGGLAVNPLDDLANTFKRWAQKTAGVGEQHFPTHPNHGRPASSRQASETGEGSRSTNSGQRQQRHTPNHTAARR